MLAYDAECAHSARVAAAWEEWLSQAHPARVVALAKDPPDSAMAYRDRHRWRVEVLAVPRPVHGTPEQVLLRRTPWLFVFDSNGILRLEAHGSELAAVDSLISGTAG